MDVVMNERTAELYTHWVEKISELATCRIRYIDIVLTIAAYIRVFTCAIDWDT